MRSRAWAVMGGAVAAAALALPGPATAADFGIEEFSIATSTQQAGAHADVTVVTAFPAYDGAATPRVRNVRLGLPAGPVGNPAASRRGLTARGDGARLKATLRRKGVLTTRAPNGAERIVVQVRKGAFRASRKLRGRLSKRPRLSFRLRVAPATGAGGIGAAVTRQTLVVRAKR
jgi:hypothetical protein